MHSLPSIIIFLFSTRVLNTQDVNLVKKEVWLKCDNPSYDILLMFNLFSMSDPGYSYNTSYWLEANTPFLKCVKSLKYFFLNLTVKYFSTYVFISLPDF